MKIHIYDSYRSTAFDKSQSYAIVADFVGAFSAWLSAQGHEVEDIPKVGSGFRIEDIPRYFHDADIYFGYGHRVESGSVGRRSAPLHELFSNRPTKLANFFPIPLLARPSVIERILQAQDAEHETVWIYFDPDFACHYALLTGKPPKGRQLPALLALPGVSPAPSFPLAGVAPRIFLFANLKAQLLNPGRYDADLFYRCANLAQEAAAPDCLDILVGQAGVQPGAILRDVSMREMLRDLVLKNTATQRARLIRALAQLPACIHTDASPADLGLAISALHPDCEFAAPQHYLDTFGKLQAGDLVVCPPVWAMRNALTERCTTSMFRGAIPILPSQGTHVEILARAGIDGIYYDPDRPESVRDTIGALLDDRFRRTELAARVRIFVAEHCLPEQIFTGILAEMNERLLESLS